MNEIKTVLEHAEQHCKASGTRLTPKRKGILKELLKSGKALSAYELTDLFNKESIKKEYNSYDNEWRDYTKNEINIWKKSYENPMISHKEFLSLIREQL